jgi:hypothetical protein
MYNSEDLKNDIVKIIEMEEDQDFNSTLLCMQILRKIDECAELKSIVGENVWHFISDADIRFKDKKYRLTQNGDLKRAILENGEAAIVRM